MPMEVASSGTADLDQLVMFLLDATRPLRDGEPRGRLRHAAGFRHREHDVKVAQPDATADAV